tara:strand:- start:170 stop:451 length:282 start_codon:yes stop_codon:yes gene_type:complete
MTEVVNLRNSTFDVYIGRAGRGEDGYFGNPFPISKGGRDECIARYREWFEFRIENDEEFKARVLELKGKRLGCFCKPQACHGDVIAEWLENNG